MKSPRSTAGRAATTGDKPYISDKARQRPVRVLPPDDEAEMWAGHLIPAAGPHAADEDAGGDKDNFSADSSAGTGRRAAADDDDDDNDTFGPTPDHSASAFNDDDVPDMRP